MPSARDARPWQATLGVIAIAALVRLLATWNDLWLDEIWTLSLIGRLHSPLGILTELRHDNNHPLNTLLLYVLRPLGSDVAYRLPAWAAGVAIVWLGAYTNALDDGARPDASAATRALVAALVLGVSHPLIHYASEARGYALALAFGLAAIALALRADVAPRSRAAPLAWGALALALLAHPLAVHVLVALLAWSAVRRARRGDGATGVVGALAWWYAVPLAFATAYYVGFLRHLTIGGGVREGILPPLARAAAFATGLPIATPAAALLLIAAAVLAVGARSLARRGSDLWVLYVVGVAVSPALLAVLVPTDLYEERYFLASMLLWLLLAARLLAWATTRTVAVATLAGATAAAFAVANAARVGLLLRDGRGQYTAALRYVAAHASGATTIASDHDFRNRLVIEYYAPRIGGPSIRYVSRGDPRSAPPEWYVAHRLGDAPAPSDRLVDGHGTRYRLVATYPTAPLSGFRWFLYRVDAPG